MNIAPKMGLKLYMDNHVPRAITNGLRLRGVDVITVFEDQAHEFDDSLLLDRATELGYVLFTQDDDLLTEAQYRQKSGQAFAGVIYAHQRRVSVGQCVRDLELIATLGEESDVRDRVTFLPL